MRHKLTCLVIFGLVLILSSTYPQSPKWKGRIEKENGTKKIINPSKPLFGVLEFKLKEDLALISPESNTGYFGTVIDVQVDDNGYIYVFESKELRITGFDQKGKHLLTIDLDRNVTFKERPIQMLVDNIGNLIYVKYMLSRIDVYDTYGYFISTRRFERSVFDFCVDDDGYITGEIRPKDKDTDASTLSKIGLQGEIIGNYAEYEYINLNQSNTKTQIIHEIFISRLDDKRIVYGWAGAYRLFEIDTVGNPYLIIEKEGKLNLDNQENVDEDKKWLMTPSYFYSIFNDSAQRIYVQTNRTHIRSSGLKMEVDIFSNDGYYLYSAVLPPKTTFIQNGFLYRFEKVAQGTKVIRFKVENWDQIKTGIN